MSHKIDKFYLAKSVRQLDDLVNEEEISSSTSIHKTDLSSDVSISDERSSPKEVTINYAIENYIEAERHMTVANHEKAYLCLIRFLKQIQRVIDNGVYEKDHYQRYKDIYDYYMSDEVKSRTFQKLALLRDHLHCEYTTMTEMIAEDREKCVSLPNDISMVANEGAVEKPRKRFDIFNINNVLKSRNDSFGSDRCINLINGRINKHNPTLRKCTSIPNGLDINWNQGQSPSAPQNPKDKFENFSQCFIFDRVKNVTTGYSHVIAPLIVKQTLLRIEEYKQKVELRPKSKNFIEYDWQKNRQIYMIKAIQL